MNVMNEDTINKLKSYQGLIQSLADLLSFPGSEFLNVEKLESDVSNISYLLNNYDYYNKLNNLKKIYIECEQQQLMVEFARLFVGPYHVIAPPYGSYFLEEGKLMGDSTIEVSNFYSNAGLEINDSFKDLPDHVVAELEFLLFLIHNEIQFVEKKENANFQVINSIKKEFFNKYFYSWIKSFSSVIFDNTESEFYKNTSLYLNAVVEMIYVDINGISSQN
jgi:TorA maturation chaperone TorD